jgi:hypothetical protein
MIASPVLSWARRLKSNGTRGRTPRYRAAASIVAAVLALDLAAALDAKAEQASKSGPLAQALSQQLEQAKLQYIAARDPSEEGRFIAAMHLAGLQLLVISAKYAAPPLITEKLIQGKYQDAYIDLSSASERASRIIIDDLRANGLPRTKQKDQVADVYEAGGKRVVFDFDWRKQKLTEEEYAKALDAAETQYSRMLTLLLERAKTAK